MLVCNSLLGLPNKVHLVVGGLNNKNLCFHHSGKYKFKIKVQPGLVSPEASLLGL
jgi:hypothetical protein